MLYKLTKNRMSSVYLSLSLAHFVLVFFVWNGKIFSILMTVIYDDDDDNDVCARVYLPTSITAL